MTFTKVVFPLYCRPTRVSSISSFQKRDLNQSKIRLMRASISSPVRPKPVPSRGSKMDKHLQNIRRLSTYQISLVSPISAVRIRADQRRPHRYVRSECSRSRIIPDRERERERGISRVRSRREHSRHSVGGERQLSREISAIMILFFSRESTRC